MSVSVLFSKDMNYIYNYECIDTTFPMLQSTESDQSFHLTCGLAWAGTRRARGSGTGAGWAHNGSEKKLI